MIAMISSGGASLQDGELEAMEICHQVALLHPETGSLVCEALCVTTVIASSETGATDEGRLRDPRMPGMAPLGKLFLGVSVEKIWRNCPVGDGSLNSMQES